MMGLVVGQTDKFFLSVFIPWCAINIFDQLFQNLVAKNFRDLILFYLC